MKRIQLICFLLFVFSACNQAKVCNTEAEYMQEVSALNLKKSSIYHGVAYDIEMVPGEKIGIMNDAPFDSISAWYTNKLEFVLRLTDTSTGKDLQSSFNADSKEYGIIQEFISNQMISHVRLIADQDTLMPVYLNPVRAYGMDKNDPILVGFDLPYPARQCKQLILQYHDAVVSEEIIDFDFKQTDYKRTPIIL